MSYYNFFMPDMANASELRSITSSMRLANRQARRARGRTSKRLDELEDDLGFLALLLFSLVGAIQERGVVTRADLVTKLEELDRYDGTADGKVDLAIVRDMLGFAKEEPAPKKKKRKVVRKSAAKKSGARKTKARRATTRRTTRGR